MWEKRGCIFTVAERPSWMVSHAAVPVALPLGNGLFRVYFSSRDSTNRSAVGYVEFDIESPFNPTRVSERPVLSPGRLGTFDDSGTMACWLVSLPDEIRMYYIGWNLGVTVPYRNSIGLACSRDGGETFERHADAPVLDRGNHAPCFVASPCVLLENEHWRMWYTSCLAWEERNGSFENRCDIKCAESTDGIVWTNANRTCIPLAEQDESVLVRPSILKTNEGYSMWYAHRGDAFRIGYAQSADGDSWIRDDHGAAAMEPSETGWDGEQVAHPHVFEYDGIRYMVFNGNGEGRTGIGLAEWKV